MVLDDLVLDDASAGILDCELGERDARLVRRHGGLVEDLVYLLLSVGGKDLLSLAHARELCLESVDGIDDLRGDGCRWFFHHVSLLVTGDLPYNTNNIKTFLGKRCNSGKR